MPTQVFAVGFQATTDSSRLTRARRDVRYIMAEAPTPSLHTHDTLQELGNARVYMCGRMSGLVRVFPPDGSRFVSDRYASAEEKRFLNRINIEITEPRHACRDPRREPRFISSCRLRDQPPTLSIIFQSTPRRIQPEDATCGEIDAIHASI